MDPSLAIKQYIVREFLPDIAPEELDDDYDLVDNGVVNSLSLLPIINWLADRYDIPIDDVDISMNDFLSVAAIRRFVSRTARERVPALSEN
ncbi:acyl carrier protein [Nonomuraea sp. MG754425]|uniref:phosphopantetheine-binding protein n=1 Tax=Nonomuraea sp. MG754425 TaxID=2570319 RepID=UPI001F1EF48F|nr:phosphopantetheine-binding protein [Nonomuraea sp. MG754425]MCF6469991.1 acyl carrier protein [Nonomuraea sp. MG754425]